MLPADDLFIVIPGRSLRIFLDQRFALSLKPASLFSS
jgi:hypothetical protein